MSLEPKDAYRALKSRDRRFDGRFFVGVTSTGVYCRPICPVPTPKPENCRFFHSAAAAQVAGFRSCLRCRPEAAPSTPAWKGSSSTVQRALRLIEGGALNHGSVDDLAGRLGIGERQLRRLFAKHLGASPIDVAQTHRLLLSKQLIDNTELPFTEIALAAGYGSVRRFNDAIRSTYARTPGDLRRLRGGAVRRAGFTGTLLTLPYRPPFAWDDVLAFLAARAIPGVEAVAAGRYLRTVRVAGSAGVLEVERLEERNCLVARLRISDVVQLLPVASRLRSLFDLEADSERIEADLSRDPKLRSLLKAGAGIRVPGAWDGFELAVRAILGQQVSVAAATTLSGRVAEKFGEPLAAVEDGAARLLFPDAERLANSDLSALGLPATRASAIRRLAEEVAGGGIELTGAVEPGELRRRLCELPGIGPWTAEYVAMRVARDPDALLASDLGVRRALERGGQLPTPNQVAKRAERWRPWRSYAVMSLWAGGGAPRR